MRAAGFCVLDTPAGTPTVLCFSCPESIASPQKVGLGLEAPQTRPPPAPRFADKRTVLAERKCRFRMHPLIPVTPQATVGSLEYAGPARVVTNATGVRGARGTFSTWVIDAPNAKTRQAPCRYVFLQILCIHKLCSLCGPHVRVSSPSGNLGPGPWLRPDV